MPLPEPRRAEPGRPEGGKRLVQLWPDDLAPGSEPPEGGGLAADLWARAASSSGLPLVEAGGMIQNRLGSSQTQPPMPVLPQARGQAVQLESDETFGARLLRPVARMAEPPALPLAAPVRIEARRESVRIETKGESLTTPLNMPVSAPAPANLVQRQPVEPHTERAPAAGTLAGEGVIQRADAASTGDSSESETMAGAELDKLAREIFPLIKRMLAVERERRPIR